MRATENFLWVSAQESRVWTPWFRVRIAFERSQPFLQPWTLGCRHVCWRDFLFFKNMFSFKLPGVKQSQGPTRLILHNCSFVLVHRCRIEMDLPSAVWLTVCFSSETKSDVGPLPAFQPANISIAGLAWSDLVFNSEMHFYTLKISVSWPQLPT